MVTTMTHVKKIQRLLRQKSVLGALVLGLCTACGGGDDPLEIPGDQQYPGGATPMPMGGETPSGMMAPGGDDMPPGGTPGNTSVLCDLLPNGDPQNRAGGQYYQLFTDTVNDSLITSCGSRGGCHATSENGFWLQGYDDPCSAEANFLMVQAYINFVDPDTSPMLTAPYDPEHNGYQIYTGRADPRFVELRNWVLLAFE